MGDGRGGARPAATAGRSRRGGVRGQGGPAAVGGRASERRPEEARAVECAAAGRRRAAWRGNDGERGLRQAMREEQEVAAAGSAKAAAASAGRGRSGRERICNEQSSSGSDESLHARRRQSHNGVAVVTGGLGLAWGKAGRHASVAGVASGSGRGRAWRAGGHGNARGEAGERGGVRSMRWSRASASGKEGRRRPRASPYGVGTRQWVSRRKTGTRSATDTGRRSEAVRMRWRRASGIGSGTDPDRDEGDSAEGALRGDGAPARGAVL
nr:translation initiation factor IF-2-like [Aegilops tauschii subsp. strangulata]